MTDRETVVIGYLSGGNTTLEFTSSLAAATNYLVRVAAMDDTAPELVGALPLKSGPRIAHGRNSIVKRFLANGADWLLMLDDDMQFAPDAPAQLLAAAHPVDRPIVGGLAIAGGRDGWFPNLFALQGTPEEPVMIRQDGWPPDQLVEVDATGAACLLVHRSVFEKVATEYSDPWIWFQETRMGSKDVGEDITFCLRARQAGFPVLVHTGVEFGHIKAVNVNPAYYKQWVESHRFIITGTGRCGTGYLATLLSSAGVSCGHEMVYGPVNEPVWGFRRGDSSWLAAPHLDRFNGYVVHLVRHPLKVIGSLLGIGFFNDELSDKHGPWRTYADEYLWPGGGDVYEGEHQEVMRCMLFVHAWNRLVEPYAHQTIRVEDITPADLTTIARHAGGNHADTDWAAYLEHVPTDINTRPHNTVGWDDLPDGTLKDALIEQARRYGYDT